MLEVSKFKSFFIILLCLVGVIFCLPNLMDGSRLPSWLQHKVNLGLELQGGAHLQFEVDLATVEREFLKNFERDIRTVLRKQRMRYSDLHIDKRDNIPEIRFLLKQGSFTKLKKEIHAIDPYVEIVQENEVVRVFQNLDQKNVRNKQILDQSIEVIGRRIDESGTKEPTIIRHGTSRIIVQLPGVDDPNHIKKLVGQTAKLEFRTVEADEIQDTQERPTIPTTSEWIETVDRRHDGAHKFFLAVKKESLLTGDHLVDAQVTEDREHGGFSVSMRFNSLGSRLFFDATSKMAGKCLAIVLDNKVIVAPQVHGPIPSGQASITGSFTLKDANDLALLLRAGALPAPLKVIEERTVGPSLGADSIQHGKTATLYAFAMVATFMILGYSLFGVFANIALIFNLILLFAGLSLLGATLTLPGIAGIAMTIGMAVDANVLIYERIKEELRKNVKPRIAIEAGYKKAMATIVDSNLTTIIGGIVLYEFSSGSVRGFAVTLVLGILVSLFTALSVTKLITAWWFGKRDIEKLPI